MAKRSAWKVQLDRWVVNTDMSTVLFEEAAKYLDKSLDESDSHKATLASGTYLGICFSIAALSGVPLAVVEDTVRRMAGVDDE